MKYSSRILGLALLLCAFLMCSCSRNHISLPANEVQTASFATPSSPSVASAVSPAAFESPSTSISPSPIPSNQLVITPTPIEPGKATRKLGKFKYWMPSDFKKVTPSGATEFYNAPDGSTIFISSESLATEVNDTTIDALKSGWVFRQVDNITYENKTKINSFTAYQFLYHNTPEFGASEGHVFVYVLVYEKQTLVISYMSTSEITSEQYGVLDVVANSVKFEG